MKLELEHTDTENQRVYFSVNVDKEKRLYCLQVDGVRQTIGKLINFYRCGEDGEPHHKVDSKLFTFPEPWEGPDF